MSSITQSIEKLQKKLDKDPNSIIFFQLAEEHRKEGNLDEALRILKSGLSHHPNYWSARVTLGRIYHQMGDSGSAREELEKVIQSVPDNLLANKILGDIYRSTDLPVEALKRYRIVQMLNPSDQEVIANIQQLESEVKKSEPEPQPLSEIQLEPEPERAEPAQSTERTEPVVDEEEGSAPTIQIRIPEFLEKTVPVKTTEMSTAEKAEEEMVVPSVEDLESLEEQDLPSDTLIVNPQQASQVQEQQEQIEESPEEIDQSNELSSLASLLLTDDSIPAEGQGFDELESELIENPEFQQEEALTSDPQLDRTQPIGEEADIENAEELTTETLAELYLNQGLIEKAVKVYQKLLLNDPGNEQIYQRLKELNSDDSLPAAIEPFYQKEEEEILVAEPDQPKERESSIMDERARRAEVRRRKITTLENWLTTIRRVHE